jgi:cell division protein FtsL
MTTRLNVLLLLALIVSSVYLVQTSYESRQLFAGLERARSTARQLELEAERLDLERRAEATHGRVDQLARQRLQMRSVTPAITAYVDDAPASEVRP